MSIISTVFLVLLLLVTVWRWYGGWNSMVHMGMQEVDIFLFPCWIGFGVYHLFT